MAYGPVTLPPVLVETSDLQTHPGTRPPWNGPIRIGTTIWIAGFYTNGFDGIQMNKSTDDGATWSHAGSLYTITSPVQPMSFIWDGGTGFLLLTHDQAGTANIARYETITQTWTPDWISSFAIGSSRFQEIACLARLSTGKIICAYARGTSPITYYRFWNGSSWTSEIRLGTDIQGHNYNGTNAYYVGIGPIIVDSSDVTHLFIYRTIQFSAATTNDHAQLYYCQVDPSGTLTTNTSTSTPVRDLADYTIRDGSPYRHLVWDDGIYRLESNDLFLTEEFYRESNTDHSVGVIRAAKPTSGASPSFAYVSLHSSTASGDLFTYYRPAFFHSLDGTYSTLVLMVGDNTPAPGLLRLFTSDDGTTWTDIVYWDPSALPPVIPPAYTYSSTESANGTITSSGRLDFAAMTAVDFPTFGSVCTILIAGHSPGVIPPVAARNYAWIGEFARTA